MDLLSTNTGRATGGHLLEGQDPVQPTGFSPPLLRESQFVTPEVAAIRQWIDDHDLSGHAHPSPDYLVVGGSGIEGGRSAGKDPSLSSDLGARATLAASHL